MQQEQLDAAVDGGPGGDGGGGGIIPSRLSPSGRNLSVSQAALAASARHRRSPTAPEQGTTSNGIAPGPGQAQGQQAGKTWTAGDMNGNGKGAVNGNGHGNMAEDGNGQMVQAQVHRTPTTTTTQYTVARWDFIYLLNVVLFRFIDVSFMVLIALFRWHKNTHDTIESQLGFVSTPKSHTSQK